MPAPAAVARALLAAGAAAGFAVAVPLAAPAPASAATARPAAGAPPVSVVINSLSPGYAQPGRTVTITGTVTNASAAPVPALSIQLSSSSQAFGSRDALQSYASGSSIALAAVPGATTAIQHALAPKATARWSVKLPASRLRISAFGVYPLAVQARNSVGATLDTGRTFLPFWPGNQAHDLAREQIAWIWPLLDQPRISPCAGLANDGLEASLGSGGRLAGLLAAGAAYARKAHLTWAIDPALLSDAQTMSSPYKVSGNGQCTGTTKAASPTARGWLSELKSATTGQPVFVTPYADVDAVALVHRGLNSDLTKAFGQGRSVAGQVLGRDFKPSRSGAGNGRPDVLSGLAWPPAGVADYPTLQSLAGVDGISAVVLDSTTMPPLQSWPPTPSAQTTTPDGEGPDLHVLLSDHTLTTILGSASASAPAGGGNFAARQYYLAETAMIAAEAPGLARSVVVAPPSRWNPSPRLARGLLADTVGAPWLRPVSAAALITAKSGSGQVARKLAPPAGSTRGMLGRSLLNRARRLDQRVQLLQSIRPRPDAALSYAMTAIESSVWRGRGAVARPGRQLLAQVSSYLKNQQSKLMLVGPARVTLGGLKGTVPVSVANHLPYPVRVRLRVAVPDGGSISVRRQPGLLKVPAGTVITVKLDVSTAAVGSTTLHLSLLTPGGAALPSAPVLMTVQATHYGTLALVIIAAALGVFMLTSAARAVRRGRGPAQQPAESSTGQSRAPHPAADQPEPPDPAADPSEPPDPAAQQSQGSHLTADQPEVPLLTADQPQWPGGPPRVPGGPAKADNVKSGPAEVRAAASTDDLEDADEYARTPGRADRDRGWSRPG
jgi:Family of unknown function (DUF6049)